MYEKLNTTEFCQQVIFLGETLGPLFLQDPLKGNAQQIFDALRLIDPKEAGAAWPFVQDEDATCFLGMMRDGLQCGIDADDLVWEYRRLFVGPGKKPVPPWGSVYTDREGVICGESTLALRCWMRENGIESTTNEQTPEDHIGLMLILLAWIARHQPSLTEDYLSRHVLTWSSHFLEQLAGAARQPFYQGLALLTQKSLEQLQEELGIAIEYPRYYR